jgi:PAT family beta-lactamase induction signal transducer AmpG
MSKSHFSKMQLFIVILGFSSGLSLTFTGTLLTAMLAENGIDIKTIGLFSLVILPYTFKYLWSPIFDMVKPPFFKGRRRSWIITLQVTLFCLINALPYSVFDGSVMLTAINALLIGFFAASQDIVIDAFRVEKLRDDEQALGSASAQLGYRLAMIFSSGGTLIFAEYLGWHTAILCVTFGFIPPLIAVLCSKDDSKTTSERMNLSESFKFSVIGPFKEFLQRQDNWVWILVFLILFKMSDAFAASLTTPFYLSLGFSKQEIGAVVKVYGFVTTIFGTYFGGFLAQKIGLYRTLWYGLLLQSLSNLGYMALNHLGHDIFALIVVMSMENFFGGIGNAVLVAYISLLCNKEFTATQFALLSSLASVTRTIVSASAGYIIACCGWDLFFLISVFLSLPALLLINKIAIVKPKEEVTSQVIA